MMTMAGPSLPGPAYRVQQGDILAYNLIAALTTTNTAVKIQSQARVIYDDGTADEFIFPTFVSALTASGNTVSGLQVANHPVARSGWLVEWGFGGAPGTGPQFSVWVSAVIVRDALGNYPYQVVAKGPITGPENMATLGSLIPCDPDRWPTWVFFGTVASDATGGTHVATLTVSPVAGGTVEILYAQIILSGAAALAASATITDGTNTLATLFSATSAGTYSIPAAIAAAAGSSAGNRFRISGAMALVLTATTSTVSQTQTFAVALRINPQYIPTAVLADTVGTPVLTTTTNKVF